MQGVLYPCQPQISGYFGVNGGRRRVLRVSGFHGVASRREGRWTGRGRRRCGAFRAPGRLAARGPEQLVRPRLHHPEQGLMTDAATNGEVGVRTVCVADKARRAALARVRLRGQAPPAARCPSTGTPTQAQATHTGVIQEDPGFPRGPAPTASMSAEALSDLRRRLISARTHGATEGVRTHGALRNRRDRADRARGAVLPGHARHDPAGGHRLQQQCRPRGSSPSRCFSQPRGIGCLRIRGIDATDRPARGELARARRRRRHRHARKRHSQAVPRSARFTGQRVHQRAHVGPAR